MPLYSTVPPFQDPEIPIEHLKITEARPAGMIPRIQFNDHSSHTSRKVVRSWFSNKITHTSNNDIYIYIYIYILSISIDNRLESNISENHI